MGQKVNAIRERIGESFVWGDQGLGRGVNEIRRRVKENRLIEKIVINTLKKHRILSSNIVIERIKNRLVERLDETTNLGEIERRTTDRLPIIRTRRNISESVERVVIKGLVYQLRSSIKYEKGLQIDSVIRSGEWELYKNEVEGRVRKSTALREIVRSNVLGERYDHLQRLIEKLVRDNVLGQNAEVILELEEVMTPLDNANMISEWIEKGLTLSKRDKMRIDRRIVKILTSAAESLEGEERIEPEEIEEEENIEEIEEQEENVRREIRARADKGR